MEFFKKICIWAEPAPGLITVKTKQYSVQFVIKCEPYTVPKLDLSSVLLIAFLLGYHCTFINIIVICNCDHTIVGKAKGWPRRVSALSATCILLLNRMSAF